MANSVGTERERLKARLAQLDEERGHILYAMAVLDRLVTTSEVAGERNTEQLPTVRHHSVPTLEAAVKAVNAADKVLRAEEALPLMRAQGWTQQVENEMETVRSALSRAYRMDLIERIGHGQYAPKGWVERHNRDNAVFETDENAFFTAGPPRHYEMLNGEVVEPDMAPAAQ
jgi:hypothetical protein